MKICYMCESTGESAKIADPEKIKAKHVNNRLFNMNRFINSSNLIYYLLKWGLTGLMAAIIKIID